MKKLIIAILVALLTFSAFACSSGKPADVPNEDTPAQPESNTKPDVQGESGNAAIAGGWQVPGDDMKAAAEEAFNKAVEAKLGYTYEMIACVSYQIVAGTNYKYICRGKAVTPEAAPEIIMITVWSKLDGTAEITEIVDLISASGNALLGGWSVNDSALAIEENEDAKAAFEKAMETLVGANHEPVAVLASQVVAGRNYQILCKSTPVVLNPQPHYTIVKIYAALDGHAEILEIVNVEDYQPEEYTAAPEEEPEAEPETVVEDPVKAPDDPSTGDVVGGWMHITEDVLPYANEAYAQATEKKLGYTYELIACTSYQVVAGMNYRYICRGTTIAAGAVPEIIQVTVYAPLTGNAELLDVTTLIGTNGQMLAGGWEVTADDLSIDQHPEAKTAFEKAIGGLVGADYEPIALLAQQVVAGMNYQILCRTTPVYPNATSYYTIVTVYANLEGNAEITDIAEF